MEGTINDTSMVLVTLHPDGPVDGEPVWSVVSGNGTLHSDPAHQHWDASLPPGFQIFFVSETLAADDPGPKDTVYKVVADVDLSTGTRHLEEQMLLHVTNEASHLGVSMGVPTQKP